jgi:hypothetical protein
MTKKTLIGINGKIGVGKDTVGKIIQHLTSEWADEEFQDTDMLDVRSNWKIKKFAGKLKVVASLLTGIPIEKFEDQEFKKTILGPEWGKPTKQNPLNAIDPFKDITFVEMMSVRDLLQKIGTEAMRNGLHENVWVNALFADYTEDQQWVITDVRFPNEYNAIKEKGGIMIRVNRPGYGNSMKELADAHPSEIALDGHEFDYVIENKGSLIELIDKVKDILLSGD